MLLYQVCNGLHKKNADFKAKKTLAKGWERKYNIDMKRVTK